MSSSGYLFEFSEPDGVKQWIATPGKQTTYPLSICNETAEGHDVAVLVEEPASWAWADPQRVSLDPGDSATVSIVFAPNKETTVAAGVHHAAIRLRDLEGVIFAECIRQFEVEERQELAMTVTLRGPLMSFGLAEGFVLHCTLANRGNVDVTVTPVGDPHPTLTFSKRTVSVPFQGEAAFDIEVRWNAARRTNHPDTVTLRAPYRDGEASASIEWRYIAEALEPFMPIYSTVEEEDELLSLSWLPQPDADLLDHRIPDFVPEESVTEASAQAGATAPVTAGAEASAASSPAAVTAQPPAGPLQHPAVLAARLGKYAAARRLSPWWPIVQVIGGKWRVKPLPILMLIIAIEGFVIGTTQAQRDFYASPELRSRIPPITRALRLGSHAAATLVGYGKQALSVTLSEGGKLAYGLHFGHHAAGSAVLPQPSLTKLSARYLNPHTLGVSFVGQDLSKVELLVAAGPTIIYNKQVADEHAIVSIPRGLNDPLRITVVGNAPRGLVLRQHVYLSLPFAYSHH